MSKQYAVIGLGRFGSAVALGLAEAGQEVIAVDIEEERVQQVSDDVTYAAVADVTKSGVCESLGFANIDVAVIGISSNMEDSILATIMTKEAGAKYIVAKAVSDIHATILQKVGADQIVFPGKGQWHSSGKKHQLRVLYKIFLTFRQFQYCRGRCA